MIVADPLSTCSPAPQQASEFCKLLALNARFDFFALDNLLSQMGGTGGL
jgi:hypothetical protein